MRVGTQPTHVLWLFLRKAALLLAAGMLIGLPLARALARFLRTMLYEVPAPDPPVIFATVVLLSAGALLASLVPVHATRVDPAQALRYN